MLKPDWNMQQRQFFASLLLVVCGLQARAYAQGQIYFTTRVAPDLIAPVLRPDGSAPGTNAVAQVVHVKDDGTVDPLFPTTVFRTDTPEAAYYVQGVTLFVPGVPGPEIVGSEPQFTSATFRVRAWEGADWDNAILRGESNDVSVPVGGNFWPAPNLDGLQGFTLDPKVTLTLDVPAALASVQAPVALQNNGSAQVQSSTDLVTWQDAGTAVVQGRSISFQVFASEARKFYRAVIN